MKTGFKKIRRGRAWFIALLGAAWLEGRSDGGQIVPAAVTQGRALFLMSCAHCHGADATGDEGPDLHGLHKSDARLAAIIKNGIKGEMPKFSAKLSEEDVQALIAFIHSLGKGK